MRLRFSKRRARLWLARLALVAASTCVGVVLAEGITRTLERPMGDVYEVEGEPCYRVTDDALGFEPIPNTCQFNELGLHDWRYSPDKPDGTRRIVVLGDSVAFGPGVRLEETFDNQLEAMLDSDAAPVEVLNMGVPGYNTAQEMITLRRRGLDLDPDLVLVAWVTNDFDATPTCVATEDGIKQIWRTEPPVPVWLDLPPRAQLWMLSHSALWRVISRAAVARRAAAGLAETTESFPLSTLGNSVALLEIADTAASRSAGVLFVLFPAFGAPELDGTLDQAVEFMGHNDLPHLDLRPRFDGVDPVLLRQFRHDPIHPSALACEIAARSVAEYLEEHGLDVGMDRSTAEWLPSMTVPIEVSPPSSRIVLGVERWEADADPMDHMPRDYSDLRGDASREAADLLDFSVGLRDGEIVVGIRLAAPPDAATEIHVEIANQTAGVIGALVIPPSGDARFAFDRPVGHGIPITLSRDGREIRASWSGTEFFVSQGSPPELRLGPIRTEDRDGHRVVDHHLITHRIFQQRLYSKN